MRAAAFSALAFVACLACSEIKVPPFPGLDSGHDRGHTDSRDPSVDQVVDPGEPEVPPDAKACEKDEDCAYLLPQDGSGCVRARCDAAKGCVLDNLPKGEPCGEGPAGSGCHGKACDGNGQCVEVWAEDGTPCDPGVPLEPCTTYACLGGECVPSGGCDDGNPCTEDSCVAETGTCQHTPMTGGACDDHDPCTIEEACFAGMCMGKPKPCDDQNPCTDDRCAKETGCMHLPLNDVPCDDGNACTRDDACQDGECKAGAYLVCDDGNRCTTDQCNPATGHCEFTPTTSVCDDGDPCTEADQCQNGQCLGTPKNCDDQDPCTADSCKPGTGCVHPVIPGCKPCATDKDCDDGNPCTRDLCGAAECQYEALTGTECDDGNPCTLGDLCEGGSCASGVPRDCNDGNVCTDDSCDPSTGECVWAMISTRPCDDGNPCTDNDQCSQGSCLGTPVSCDDGNVCTDEWCDPATGKCTKVYNTKPCDDGRFCTNPDQCSQGVCVGTPVTCNDNNACTIDTCDEDAKRCVNNPIPNCLSCTTDTDCNDHNACTQDKCVSSKCEFTPLNGTPCNDGNQCTANDLCKSGVCQPGPPVTCAPKDCFFAFCDPVLGCHYHPQPGGPCDDGDPCTGPDQCVSGTCVAGPLLCCEGRTDGTPCSDQDNATGPDYCIGGRCRGFYVVPFQAGDQTGLIAADASAGPVAVGWFQNEIVSERGPTGFVANVPFGAKPSIIQATLVQGKLYRSVSSWLAVGDGGLVAYRTSWSTGWVVGGVLGETLASMDPKPGDLADVFGRLGPESDPVHMCRGGPDSYLLVGRDISGTKPWARHCVLREYMEIPGPCGTEAICGQFTLQDLDPALTWPVAVAGLPAEQCPGPCLAEAAIASRVDSPLGIFQSAVSRGVNSGKLIETFETMDVVPTPGSRVRDAVRLNDPALGAVYVAVGDAGTFLIADVEDGAITQTEVMENQWSYDFTGIALDQTSGYLFLSANSRKENGSVEQVLVVHPLTTSVAKEESYFPMTLRRCEAFCGPGFSLDDVTARGGEVILVGNSVVNKKPSGLIYYLKF